MPCEICGGIVKKGNAICCYCRLAQQRADNMKAREEKKKVAEEVKKERRKMYFKTYYEKNREQLCFYARERYNINKGEFPRRLELITKGDCQPANQE